MDYHVKSDAPERTATDCLVLGVLHDGKLSPAAAAVDDKSDGALKRLIKRDHFDGKAGDTLLINGVKELDGCKCERVLLVGLGKKSDLDTAKFRKVLAATLKGLRDSHAKTAAIALLEVEVDHHDGDIAWMVRQAVEVFEAGSYRFTQMKKEGDDRPPRLAEVSFLVSAKQKKEAERGVREGEAIAYGMGLAKDMANLPGNVCTPTYLAERAEQLAKHHPRLKAEILGESELDELGMGAFLSVSRGSRQPARLIVLEYNGGPKKAKPVVLIGKGLTFDAGGISLKPAANMDEMKYDMCGGASVIATLAAIEKLQLPLNVVGLVPASENLPDGNANKPGDIVKSMAGVTIEILNTDAEGRLLLCDVLTYAKRYHPAAVIDVATLTGACIVALGRHPSGLMGNRDELCDALIAAGNESWDRVWRLPIWDDYQEQLKSNFADVANIGGPDGGSITAGCFLSRFAKDYPWAHVDIAGTAWKTGADKGATGRPVPLLMHYLLAQAR